MNKVRVVGLGPGNLDYLLPIGKKIIENAQVLVGGSRHLDSFEGDYIYKIVIDGNYKDTMEFLKNNYGKYDIAVVVSGDTGFYSLSKMIKKNVPLTNLEFIPGISSMQYFFSKLCLSWDRALLKSVHGRKFNFIEKIDDYEYIGLLTDKLSTPSQIAKDIIASGHSENIVLHIGEKLSYEDEVIKSYSPLEASDEDYDPLSVVIIENTEYKGE